MDARLLVERGRRIACSEGSTGFLWRYVRLGDNASVRRLLPPIGYCELNGVPYRERKLFDAILS
jgi:hypothetical protein